jgi:hypothetical protein
MLEFLFETAITPYKKNKTNYEDQFKINQMSNDKIKIKNQ